MKKESIEKNYIYNLIYQMLAMVSMLVTIPYLSRVLGTDDIGIYSYTYSIVTYFILIGSLGITMYGQREIAYVQDDKQKRSKIFFQLLLLKITTNFLVLIFYFFFFCINNDYSLYYKILSLEIIASMLDITWLFQGMEQFKKVAMRNGLIRLISLTLIFVVVKKESDLTLYFLITSLSTLLGNISLWFNLKKYICFNEIKNISYSKFLKNNLKKILLLFIPQIAVQIYTVLDKTMLGIILEDMSEVAFYERSQNIVRLTLTVLTSFGTIIFSRMSYIFKNKNNKKINEYIDKSFDFIWLIGFPLMFGLAAVSDNFIPWYLGEKYLNVIKLLNFSCPIILIVGISHVVFAQYLISTNKNKIYTKAVISGAITNILLNLILIRYFRATGAIISSVIAEIVILGVQMIYTRKEIKFIDNFKESIKYLINSIIMFISIKYISAYLEANIINTFILVIIGIVIYFVLIFAENKILKIYNNRKLIKEKRM